MVILWGWVFLMSEVPVYNGEVDSPGPRSLPLCPCLSLSRFLSLHPSLSRSLSFSLSLFFPLSLSLSLFPSLSLALSLSEDVSLARTSCSEAGPSRRRNAIRRDPPRSSVQGGLMRSERKHGLSTEQVPRSAYVGSSKNLKDVKNREFFIDNLAVRIHFIVDMI